MTFDPRFKQAVQLFNEREFFACHDVLEEIWSETLGNDRTFYQGLIHAAVCLFHFQEGNLGGARRMYHSAVRYLEPFVPRHGEIEVERLLHDLTACCAPLIAAVQYPDGLQLDETQIPVLIRTQASHE